MLFGDTGFVLIGFIFKKNHARIPINENTQIFISVSIKLFIILNLFGFKCL